MPAYCAKADLIERFGSTELAQLTDITAATTPVDATIAKACDEATALIDSYVAKSYVTPLTPVPAIVKTWACAIARLLLWKDRAGKESPVREAYDLVIAQIKDVAKGVASLPDATGATPSASGGRVYVLSSAQIFTDDVLAAMP